MSEAGAEQAEQPRIRKTLDERKAILDSTLQQYGARHWRIETRSDVQATIAKGKEISHGLHLFLTIVTIGVWLLVWGLLGMFGGNKRRMITIDEYGNAIEQKL